jgi:hypothetical protein
MPQSDLLLVPPRGLVDSGATDGATRCSRGGDSLPQGVLNVSSCHRGAPAFVSCPHFLGADPQYRSEVGGLHPDPGRRRSCIVLEPVTGHKKVTMHSEVRILQCVAFSALKPIREKGRRLHRPLHCEGFYFEDGGGKFFLSIGNYICDCMMPQHRYQQWTCLMCVCGVVLVLYWYRYE